MIALFATLRAGAAYVPVDTEHPAPRLAFLVSDSRPHVIVTTVDLADGLPDTTASVVTLDDSPAPQAKPRTPATPDDPLCLIYTSGSTGRPKGAVITHRGMVNLFHHHRTTMIEPAEREHGVLRAALTASLSFDTSWEGLLWLLAGHELHFVADLGQISQVMREDDADHGNVCTSTERTAGRSRATVCQVSPESAEA